VRRVNTAKVDLLNKPDHPVPYLFEHSPVFGLFIDTIELAKLAGQTTGSPAARGAAARASIRAAVLIPGAIASAMRRHNRALADAKIATVARLAPDLQTYLSEQCAEEPPVALDARAVQIRELTMLRDTKLAHAPRRIKEMVHSEGPGYHAAKAPEPELLPALGISADEERWNHDSAIAVLRALADFFNYYFLELNPLRGTKILNFFGTNRWFKNNGQVWWTSADDNRYRDASIQYAVEGWRIDLRFLDRFPPHSVGIPLPAPRDATTALNEDREPAK
jgi:hypothetical protein